MSIFCTRNVNFMFGCACKWPAAGKWGGGGWGELAALAFLCDTSWENSIIRFGNILERDIK